MSEQQEQYNRAARQLDRLREMSQPAALAALKQMDPTIFELMTALLFEERGYPATSSGKPGDEGVDVLLQDGDYVGVVQCKRYDGSVGQPTIRDLYGTMMHNQAEEAYLVTTGTVTRQARDWAFGKPIHLVDGHALAAWVTHSEQNEADFALSSWFSGFFRLGWLRWPALIVGLLLFGWGIFFAVTQLSTRFSNVPTNPDTQIVEQQVEFAEDETVKENSEESVAVDTPAPVTPVANAATSTPTNISTAIPTTIPMATPQPVTPTVQPLNDEPSNNEPSTDAAPLDPVTAPTAAGAAAPVDPPAIISTVAAPTAANDAAVKTCAAAPDSSLRAWYDEDRLGCATGEMQIVWAAWQPFERGIMLWRSDTDLAYAFVEAQQQWFPLSERWDGTSTAERGDPPVDAQTPLQAPVRGFGYAWGVNDALFNTIGWATEGEKGICLAVQPFEEGAILQSSTAQSCTAEDLFNQARAGSWQPFTIVAYLNGSWE